MLSSSHSIACGSIDHRHAGPGCGIYVDVVHARAGATNHVQLLTRSDDLGCHLRTAAHDQAIEVANSLE